MSSYCSPSFSLFLPVSFSVSLCQLCAHVTRIFAQLKSIKLHFRLNKLGPRFGCCLFHLLLPLSAASSCFVQCLGQLLFVYVSALGVLASIRQPSAAACGQLLLAFSYISLPVLFCLSLFIPCQTLNTLATHMLLALSLLCCLSGKYSSLLSSPISALTIFCCFVSFFLGKWFLFFSFHIVYSWIANRKGTLVVLVKACSTNTDSYWGNHEERMKEKYVK